MTNTNIKGQMLMEVLVATGLMIVVLIAAVGLSVLTLKSSRVGGERLEATQWAQRCINGIIGRKEDDPVSFFATPQNGCGCTITNPIYICAAAYSDIDATQKKVKVTITWPDGEISSETILSKRVLL
jgi:Tfp pilus assembly protein PilV